MQIYNGPVPAERIAELKADAPFPMADVTIMETAPAYEYVLKNAGATKPKRDAVDVRVIKTVKTGKAIYEKDADKYTSSTPYVKRRLPSDSYKNGIITDPRQVGGLPEYKGKPRVDSDNDGLPDTHGRRNMVSIPTTRLTQQRIRATATHGLRYMPMSLLNKT